ncbi:MAG: protein translocase subunit SecDF [Bacteroidota bacterium]
MQGKGIIKFFLVVMLLVTAVQYLFILPTNAVEKDAAAYGEEQSAPIEGEREKAETYKVAVADYLDSMSNKEVFRIPLLKSYTYQDLKAQQLAYGLDLKGGMSVVLQVDLREFIRSLASSSKDPTFDEALNLASQAQASAQDDFVALFADAWQSVKGDKKLATIFQRNDALRDQIGLNTSDAQVVLILRERADETVNLTYELLKKRIDQLGVVQPNVSLDAERDLILVELPGIDNPERARNVLQAAANLEFFDIYRLSEGNIVQSLIAADELLDNRAKLAAGADSSALEKEPEFRYDTIYATDTLGNLTSEIATIDTVEIEPAVEAGPLFSIFQPNNGNLGPAVLGIAERTQVDEITKMLNDPEVKRLFPRDLAFRWAADPLPLGEGQTDEFYELYLIKVPRDGKAPLSGDYVTDASANPDPTGQIAVNLSMNSEGGRIWSQWTARAAADQNRQVAILLDGEVVSAPSVRVQIDGGNTSITGNFSVQEADDLANILKIGSLPATTQIIQESIIGPSLGAENISRSFTAFIIGFALLMAFMFFYYGGGGIVSVIALILNMIFIFGALASIGTVLTLPGIAGILLTIGMAVDANVIIYERIREEIRLGKDIASAVADGFQNSYSAIIDANVTTVLVAAVLAYFGLGPIKGFAIVLIIGVLSSVFTAVLVGRLMIEWWLGRGKNITFWTSGSKNAFANMNIDWLGKRRVAYIISGVLVVGSLISIGVRGFDLGVDFKGGYSYTVQFAENISAEDLRSGLAEPFGSTPTVKAVDASNTFNIVTDFLINDTEKDAQDRVMVALHEGVKTATGNSALSLEDFSSADLESGTHVLSVSKVGPTIADDIKRSSLIAGSLALILIFLYLLLRFTKWQYSLGAVLALFHDSIIVLGFFSVFWGILPFNMEVDQAFIAAILTVIGYSINDTVVVFDRIREYLNTYTSSNKTEIINRAVNSTVSRTVITSLTTFFVVAVLFFLGGTSIRGFAFALMVGILVGTYSSIFVATPVVHDFADDLTPKEVEPTTLDAKVKA